MPDDIITRLTAFHGLPRCTTPGCVTCDAAAEIERLRAEIIAVRAERDSAQTQADHLAQRLVQEARRAG